MGGGGAGSGNGRLDLPAAARPRGMSDASFMRGGSDGGVGSSNTRGYAARALAGSSASASSELYAST